MRGMAMIGRVIKSIDHRSSEPDWRKRGQARSRGIGCRHTDWKGLRFSDLCGNSAPSYTRMDEQRTARTAAAPLIAPPHTSLNNNA